MRYDSRIAYAIVRLAVSAVVAGQALAQAPTRDQQMLLEAQLLNDRGQFSEAAAKYEEMIKAFPHLPTVPEAWFRAGYAHYLTGNYDGATAAFKKVIDDPSLAPELAAIKELSLSLAPEVLVAKAAKLEPNDPARKGALEDAVQHYKTYLGKYPKSDEVEPATYSMAMTLYQLGKFDEAAKVLRENVKEFVASPTIQDSQYLLARTLAAMAGQEMARPNPAARTADAQFDEAESLLTDIIKKDLNLALVNDAQFQLGDLLSARAGFLNGDADNPKRKTYRDRALKAYGSVISKDRVVAAQKARVTYFYEQMLRAGRNKDAANFQKFKRILERETGKLAIIEGEPDPAQRIIP